MLTQALVKELFNYDPETGILTNRITRGPRATAGGISGTLSGKGYLSVCINGIRCQVHRICFLHYFGHLPLVVDHEDTNRLNNKILNLRKCTAQQNSYNAKTRKDNKSGIKGVHWHKKKNRWVAQISFGGKQKSLGYFTDIEDARKAVEAARIELHGEFARHD